MNAALLLTALFNGAWQGAALCAVTLFAFRIYRRLNAATMFTVWSALLAITVALPAANYAFAPKPYTVRVASRAVTPAYHSGYTLTRMTGPARSAPIRYHAAAPAPIAQSYPAYPSLRERAVSLADAVFAKAAIVIWLLAIVALLRLSVLARDVVRMLGARRRVRLIDAPVSLTGDVTRPFRFAASNDFSSPCVLGFSPALIVLPEELLDGTKDDLLSIVLHEREHVRRFDDIQNVVQRFIGAIAFFCPGVRIALRELALYREQICDDAAVNGTGDRVSYAMTLTGMAQWAQGRGAPVPSLIFKRKQLLHRLEVLLDSAVSHSLRMNRRFVITAATVLAIAALLVLRIQVPVIAESFAVPPAPHAPAAPKPALPARVAQVHVPPKPALPARVPALPIKPHLPPRTKPVQKISVAPVALPQLQAVRVKIAALVVVPRNAPEAMAQAAIAVPRLWPGVRSMRGSRPWQTQHSDDVLGALNAAGLHNLSVDDLIAIRDHGVSTSLIRSAVEYFGHLTAQDLTYLSDHGIGANYIETLRMSGVAGIAPASAVLLMDHGVSAPLIHSATAYFSPRPSAADLSYLADHGISGLFIESLRASGLNGVSIADAVRLLDHGVTGAYILKIRRVNPHASIDDIIRLRDAGF